MKNGLRVLVKCCERGALQKGGALGITIRVVRHPHSFPGVQEHTTHSKVIETLSDCPVSEAEALGPGSRSHPVRPVEPIPEAASRRARRDQATRSQITHRISCREAAGNADHRVTTECCRWRCPHCADGVACGVDRAVAPGPARWLLVLPIIVEYCGWLIGNLGGMMHTVLRADLPFKPEACQRIAEGQCADLRWQTQARSVVTGRTAQAFGVGATAFGGQPPTLRAFRRFRQTAFLRRDRDFTQPA